MPFDPNFNVPNNDELRRPQKEGWQALQRHYAQADAAPEVGIVLPVGCGKSGLIAITPFALQSRRVLVVAPGLRIRNQLGADLKPNSETNFYELRRVLGNAHDFPETTVVESGRVNIDDLTHSDIVVANIQQIAGEENRWLDQLGSDFFDTILVDEAHHNTAESWQQVSRRFPRAKIVNFSATPARADGGVMLGQVIYSFPVIQAIEAGYVKRLRAKMLRPTELRYIDGANGERVIDAEEARRMGEQSSEFRRGIVMSPESLSSLVDQSIAELRRLRTETGEQRLKIIASAVNYDHCIQITEAFRGRGLRADYVHSREDSAVNERVFQRLKNHEIDVIVQARMLGEGFDHKYLSVAMVGSIFANLSPFVQFVGRIMRAIAQSQPGHVLNQGVVVFHVGANVARRWDDFRIFSQADQNYFADLLPAVEEVELDGDVTDREPTGGGGQLDPVEVVAETGVRAADLPPIGDPHVADLLAQLAAANVSPEQVAQEIRRLRTSHQDLREARRASLNDRVQHEAGGLLGRRNLRPGGKTLDPAHRMQNFAWVAAELHRMLNERIGRDNADRQNCTLAELDTAHAALPELVRTLEERLAGG